MYLSSNFDMSPQIIENDTSKTSILPPVTLRLPTLAAAPVDGSLPDPEPIPWGDPTSCGPEGTLTATSKKGEGADPPWDNTIGPTEDGTPRLHVPVATAGPTEDGTPRLHVPTSTPPSEYNMATGSDVQTPPTSTPPSKYRTATGSDRQTYPASTPPSKYRTATLDDTASATAARALPDSIMALETPSVTADRALPNSIYSLETAAATTIGPQEDAIVPLNTPPVTDERIMTWAESRAAATPGTSEETKDGPTTTGTVEASASPFTTFSMETPAAAVTDQRSISWPGLHAMATPGTSEETKDGPTTTGTMPPETTDREPIIPAEPTIPVTTDTHPFNVAEPTIPVTTDTHPFVTAEPTQRHLNLDTLVNDGAVPHTTDPVTIQTIAASWATVAAGFEYISAVGQYDGFNTTCDTPAPTLAPTAAGLAPFFTTMPESTVAAVTSFATPAARGLGVGVAQTESELGMGAVVNPALVVGLVLMAAIWRKK